MSRGRGILAVIGGFLTMALIVMALTAIGGLLPGMVADGMATPLWLAINLSYSLAAALAGGWVAAHLATGKRMQHGIVLAALVAAPGAASGFQPQPGPPGWYPAVILAIAGGGVLLGAFWRASRDD